MEKCGFRLYDKKYHFPTARATYLNALKAIKNKHPSLYERLALIRNTKDRGFFVKTPEEVYIKSPELSDMVDSIGVLEVGWYTPTNINNPQKVNILLSACGITGIKYLDEFEIWFDGGNNKYTPQSKVEAEHELNLILDQFKI